MADSPASPPEAPPPSRRGAAMRRLRYLAIALAALAALAWGGREVWSRFTHVHEYDARIKATMMTLSSKVNGVITAIPVREGDRVEAGQVLAQLDDRIPALRMRALEAELAGLEAERRRLEAERRMLDAQTSTRMRTRESDVHASEAERGALLADLDLARSELRRARALHERRVVSRHALDQAEARLRRLEGELRKADAETRTAEGQMAEAEADRQRLDVLDTELAMLDHRSARLLAELEQQRVEVDNRVLRSPTVAVIDRIFVEMGEFMNSGRRMILLHDPRELWVEANIKETELRRLRVGQPVAVSVDAWPDTPFQGRVERIGHATTAKFALLPTPNPSGNFTKITQRVPVRISLPHNGERLLPGMMVEVNIDVRDR